MLLILLDLHLLNFVSARRYSDCKFDKGRDFSQRVWVAIIRRDRKFLWRRHYDHKRLRSGQHAARFNDDRGEICCASIDRK